MFLFKSPQSTQLRNHRWRRFFAIALVVFGVTGIAAMKLGMFGNREPAQASVSAFSLPLRVTSSFSSNAVTPQHLSIIEPRTGEAAVLMMLSARVRHDARTGWALLDSRSRRRYPVIGEWAQAQTDLAPPVSFRVLSILRGRDHVDVTLRVSRTPLVDDTLGFVPAQATEIWRALLESKRWRVGDFPQSSVPQMPADQTAAPAVSHWLHVLGVNMRAANAAQNHGTLYGPRDLLAAPSKERGAWKVTGPAQTVGEGFADVEALVAAFGPGIDVFVRLVPVAGPAGHGYVAVVPLASRWVVAGIMPAASGDSFPSTTLRR